MNSWQHERGTTTCCAMNLCFRWIVLAAVAACASPLLATPSGIKHEFLALDEGLVTLLHIDEKNPGRDWVVPVGRATPRDMQLIGDGRVLVGHDAGYSEFELATGKVRREVTRFKGVTSARRLASGHTLLAGVNLDGAKGIVLLEIDAADAVQRTTVIPGNYVRLVRETAEETFLLMNDAMIREAAADGAVLHEWIVPGFRHAWKALRLPDGHTLASAGYGAFMAELDAGGKMVRKFGGKETVPAAIAPNFYATFQLLANGHVVVANWQGHGSSHGASGAQLIEFDPKGALVWQWSDPARISSLQGVLILDGLDPALLHDERNGVMAPVASR
jgi:hypothetical protein